MENIEVSESEIDSDLDSTLLQLEQLSQQQFAVVDEQRLKQNINVLNDRIDYLLNYVQQHKDDMTKTQFDDIMIQINDLFNRMTEHADERFNSISTKLEDIETSIDELSDSINHQSIQPAQPHPVQPIQPIQPHPAQPHPVQPQPVQPHLQPQQPNQIMNNQYKKIMSNPYVKFYNDYMMLNKGQKELVKKAKGHFKKVNNSPEYKRGALLDVAKRNKNLVSITDEGLKLFKTDVNKYDFPFVDDGSEEAKNWLSFS